MNLPPHLLPLGGAGWRVPTAGPRAWLIRLLFIGLVPCLLLQLALRPRTEPYPAILLPSGATLVHEGAGNSVSETRLIAEDSEGNRHPFEAAAILDSVPADYHPYIVARGFGLAKERDVRYARFSFLGREVVAQFGRPLTARQREETRDWLRSRLLQRLGIDAVRIHVLVYSVETFSREKPPRVERRAVSTVTLELAGASG